MMNCKHHGELTPDKLIKKGKGKKGEQLYRCRQCMKDLHDKFYEINKEIVLQKQKEYKKQYPEKIALAHAKSAKKYRDRDRERNNETKRIWDRKQTEMLGDRYIKKLIAKRSNISETMITQSLIECKRAIILLKKGMKYKQVKGVKGED